MLADDAQPPRAGARAMVPSGVVLGNPTRRIAPRQPRPTLDLWSQTLRTRTPLLRGVSCPVRARCPGQSRTCLRLVQVVRVNRQPQPDSCPTPRLRYRLQRRRRPTGAFLRGDPSPPPAYGVSNDYGRPSGVRTLLRLDRPSHRSRSDLRQRSSHLPMASARNPETAHLRTGDLGLGGITAPSLL